MPSLEGNLLNDPLGVIALVFERCQADGSSFADGLHKHLKARIVNTDSLGWIPSLNDVPLHKLKGNCLVRYRGMIQDMFGPEIFLSQYELGETENGPAKELRCGLYTDIAECPSDRVLLMESPNQVLAERQMFYCVPLPGETAWAKEVFASQGEQLESLDSQSQESECQGDTSSDNTTPTRKRTRPDDETSCTAGEVTMGDDSTGDSSLQREHASVADADSAAEGQCKRVKVSSEEAATPASANPVTGVQSVNSLNFPLPGEQGPPCIVKVYDDIDSYRVNEMVEFIGVLSVDPALTSDTFSHSPEALSMDIDTAKEDAVRSPPPSIVPRLHCVAARRLPHSNPLLAVEPELFKQQSASAIESASSCREELCRQLAVVLGGDQLAAQFLLLNLVSTVYARHDASVMGKFSLNLANISNPCSGQVVKQLSEAIQLLVPKFYCLPMSLEHLNNRSLCPKKNYSTNRLTTGELQLSAGTVLLLDESAMTEGQLNERGIANIVAINSVLSQQKLAYDFQFQTIDFQTNVNAIIVSEGKSILQVDCLVPVHPDAQCPQAPTLTGSQLCLLRSYLTAMQQIDYDLSGDMQKHLQEDFVAMRKASPDTVTGDTFHCLLLIARLLSISHGRSLLDVSTWNDAKQLEALRLARVSTPQPPAST